MLSLSKVYEGILKSMQYDVDDSGLVSIVTPTGTKAEAKVNGARLVIPTNKRLRDGFTEDLQPYHPLCESLSRKGTSPVLQHMQRSVKQHLGFLVSFMADALVKMSLNTSIHKDLPPDMSDVLMKLTGVTDKTQTILDKLIPAAHKQNKLITVYLKGPGTFQGQKVNRVAVIRFPILDELDNDADKDNVLGVKVPSKQRKVISNLLRLIVPFGDSPEEYSAGTVSRVAPFFTAFLQAYHKIATRLNQSINRYAGPLALPLKPIELFPLEWIEEFPKIYNQIPSLNGNDGGTDEVAEETQAAPAPQQQQQRQTQQVVTPQLSGAMPQMANMFSHNQVAAPQASRPASASAPQNQKPTQTVAQLLASTQPQMPQPVYQQPQMMQYPPQQMVNQYGQIVHQMPMMPQMQQGGQAQLPWVAQQQMQMQPQNPYMAVFQQQQQMPQQMPMQYGQQFQQYGQQQMMPQYGSNGL
ncbi:hypothetical protein [Pseudomonas phage D6]|nr:hypothetical protein [Pseudomonas phage D6]